jgi:protein SCO1/2
MGTHAAQRFAAFAALLALALGAGAAGEPALRSGVFKPPRAAPDFTLRGSDGADLRLSRYRGKVVALGFGYTYCPDVCPTTLHDLARARAKLGAAGRDFQVVYVTVDPERDTAERLRQYVAAFDPSFLGATGTPEQLDGVRKDYGILTTRKEVAGKPSAYQIHHSSYVYLIDRTGTLRAMMPFGVTVEDMAHDVQVLLGK